MSWMGIERNKLDYILTDLLPVELSKLFSFTHFYDFLSSQYCQKELEKCVNEIKNTKGKGEQILLKDSWGAVPLRYNILKGNDSFREMSLIQPVSALNIYLFMECYQSEILDLLGRNNGFSLRYHKKNTELFFKGRNKKTTLYLQKLSKIVGKGIIEQAGNYFKLVPFESINAFADSRVWRMCNFKFKYYAKIDYKSCFDSIYTHAYKWIIERNVIDSKNANNPSLFLAIDRVMQNVNGLSSNGIVVGPEFSRMIAEILLQQIDVEVMHDLLSFGMENKRDYHIFRYVDDIFVYANEATLIERIISCYKNNGNKYRLQLNELKLAKGETPYLQKQWIERTRRLSDTISGFFYPKKELRNISNGIVFLVKKEYVHVDKIKDEISALMKNYPDDRRSIVSYLLSTLHNNISRKDDGYLLFDGEEQGKAGLLLELAFFLYAFYPSFEQTRKVISIITFLDSEVDFKKNAKKHDLLGRIIRRYNFVFLNGNIHDLCDWFPFLIEYDVPLDVTTEDAIITKAMLLDDPIVWGNILIYSCYHVPFKDRVRTNIEDTIRDKMSYISQSDSFLYKELWYLMIFCNCPHISSGLRKDVVDYFASLETNLKSSINGVNNLTISKRMKVLVCEYIRTAKDGKVFFDWDSLSNFSQQITYRTLQRTLFKKYRKNKNKLDISFD